jgi:hypothetical protein
MDAPAYPFPNGAPTTAVSPDGDEFEAEMDKTIATAVEGGLIQKADTWKNGGHFGNPADTFTATVNRYNELCEAGEDEDFYKESYRMLALNKAPFYGFRNTSFALSTMDGVRIDTHSRPIDLNGVAFEGLYVIGDCSGSYFAYTYPNLCTGYAHGRTLTFACRVAREIAGEEVRDYTIMATTDAAL